MSERLTNAWTKTTAEAFGDNPNVRLGRAGEIAVYKDINSWPRYEAIDHEEDYHLQLQGIDLSLKKDTWLRFFTIDVKTGRSYLDDYGIIKVDATEDGWLFNSKKTSDRLWHVNLDTRWMAWYDREDMKRFVKKNNLEGADKVLIPPSMKLEFVFRRKLNDGSIN